MMILALLSPGQPDPQAHYWQAELEAGHPGQRADWRALRPHFLPYLPFVGT